MRNIINFDVRGDCTCACVCNIHDGGEIIRLIFEADTYNAPRVELSLNDSSGETTTVDLEVVNGRAVYDLNYLDFTADTIRTVRYVDGEKIGTWLRFGKKQDGTIPLNRTMKVTKILDYAFEISFVSGTGFSDDFEVDDGEIKLKSAVGIEVSKSDGKVSNVTILYDDNTRSSNNCTYDTNGNLTKFGNLPITWGGV